MPAPFYFQVDFTGEEAITPGMFEEGLERRHVVVEVASEAFRDKKDATSKRAPIDAEEIARNTASELVRSELAEVEDPDGRVTMLDEFPPQLREVVPDVEDDGVRAWVVHGSSPAE
jgi:hypothetical protein